MRVQIPAYTDRWMMGDRYGEVVTIKAGSWKLKGADAVYRVKLDKSGRVISVKAADCTEV